MNPVISIIIPTYNRFHLIGETLDSVIAQTYQNWECIVVDDGSTDYTPELMELYIENDKRIKYHHRPKDRLKGANACRNYGFELSKGKFINWFDDDDVMFPKFIEQKLTCFQRNIQIVICSGNSTDKNLQKEKKLELLCPSELYKGFVLWKNKIITNSVLFKKSFLLNKHLFLPNMHRGQEAEFFSRIFFEISLQDYEIIDIPLFLYRQHPGSVSTKNILYVKKYKFSQAVYATANFKRGILIKDKELIRYFYDGLLELFFEGIENEDSKNSKFILRFLVKTLARRNLLLSINIFFLGIGSIAIKKRSFFIRNTLKSITPKIRI